MFIVLIFRTILIACLISLVVASATGATMILVTYRLGGFAIAWRPVSWLLFFLVLWNVSLLLAGLAARQMQIFPFGPLR